MDILLGSSVRALIVAGIVAGVLLVLRIGSNSVRHAAWTGVLVSMLLMPALPYVVPPIAVPLEVTPRPIRVMPVFSDAVVRTPASIAVPPLVAHYLPVEEGREAKPYGVRIAMVTYVIVALALLTKLLIGWRVMRRVVRAGEPIEAGFQESPLVAIPVTLGVISPRIILPNTWRSWPDEKLQAILAHERAHIQRRDPLVSFLAHLNRCVFWFHPLAWWLEKKLAADAEHACDDAAVRRTGQPRQYAQILVEMAEAVRRRGRRLSWQGTGVDGNGLLDQRIDRILRADVLRSVSRTRRALVALSLAATIFLVVACREQARPLQPDPKITEEMARQKVNQDFHKAALIMTPQQVADLEASLKGNLADDQDALKKLLIYYSPDFSGKPIQDSEKKIAARRKHILWLIENHPDSQLAGQQRIYTTSLDPLPDVAGYEQAKKLWLARTAQTTVSADVLRNAASFFMVADKPLAEEILLKGQAQYPDGDWSHRLGVLYSDILLGSIAEKPLNVIRQVSMAEAHSAYADRIRRKLAESTDEKLLLTAAGALARARQSYPKQIDFNPVPLAKSYAERALELNPQSIAAQRTLDWVKSVERSFELAEVFKNTSREARDKAIDALPEAERFAIMPGWAESSYMMGEYLDWEKRDGAKAEWDRARRYAAQVLALAPRFISDPNYGTAIYKANMTMGLLVLRDGNRKAAVRYMLEASKAPVSEELARTQGLASARLPKYLLKEGERDTVIEYLERMAQISVTERTVLLESAAAIRAGRMPAWYQWSMAPR